MNQLGAVGGGGVGGDGGGGGLEEAHRVRAHIGIEIQYGLVTCTFGDGACRLSAYIGWQLHWSCLRTFVLFQAFFV